MTLTWVEYGDGEITKQNQCIIMDGWGRDCVPPTHRVRDGVKAPAMARDGTQGARASLRAATQSAGLGRALGVCLPDGCARVTFLRETDGRLKLS
jgi:hypothetical protein